MTEVTVFIAQSNRKDIKSWANKLMNTPHEINELNNTVIINFKSLDVKESTDYVLLKKDDQNIESYFR